MNERTREYLRGRFGDHYRRVSIEPPPRANEREWGYIPFSEGGTRMVRHRAWIDLVGGADDLADALADDSVRPQHVYYSAGSYDDPGANSMGQKGWRGSDLVFDLDADHLPGVDPEAATYAEMLATCKEALLRLLDILEDDFGFEDTYVVFSGGRGYHVHVRREDVQALDRSARGEIAVYVRGAEVAFEDLIRTEAVGGEAGRKSPAEKRSLPPEGGWSGRLHAELLAFVDEVAALDDEAAVERLREFENVGEKKAQGALRAMRNNRDAIAAGNIDVHPAFFSVARTLLEDELASAGAPIDEPVTTDINRLIRLPGSLHGGSGLAVKPLARGELADFDPLADAVPDTFRDNEIRIEVTEPGPVELLGEEFTIQEGERQVTEARGVFLMARGRAEKAPE
ncbi:DNA primase small subunit PriS [Haloglomus halophilum]|uniref:DNA primase small subunit PriS n=1 Tax=Haloglomus halophilum TaxID=2962672 RepID=UPI0020CA0AA6|nr:DNA primase small subunit PriS [Haloglomus halophilum]